MSILLRCFIFGLCCVTAYTLRESLVEIHPNARWKSDGITVAGGNGNGAGLEQLSMPTGLYVDDDQTIYVVDRGNHRIVEWKSGATIGQVVAGGNEPGNNLDQLNQPFDVIVDKESDSLIISDSGNQRVVRWPRQNGNSGETIISNVACRGLTMDDDGSLYVVDADKSEVRKYRRGETEGVVVAGGHGLGHDPNQLFEPQYIFVDRDHSLYVSEFGQSRVTKWMEGAEERIIVAGGNGKGVDLSRMVYNEGMTVDQLGTIYVADLGNNRIIRWPKEATVGDLIIGGTGLGQAANQLSMPFGLSFDRQGNLYVVDKGNHRVQKFDLEFNE